MLRTLTRAALLAGLIFPLLVNAQEVGPEFTAQQAAEGKAAYDRACASCHGRNLDDGQFAPPLRGSTFNTSFAGKSISIGPMQRDLMSR